MKIWGVFMMEELQFFRMDDAEMGVDGFTPEIQRFVKRKMGNTSLCAVSSRAMPTIAVNTAMLGPRISRHQKPVVCNTLFPKLMKESGRELYDDNPFASPPSRMRWRSTFL